MCLFLIGDAFYLGFKYYQKSKEISLSNEPIPTNTKNRNFHLIGLVLCFIDFCLISSETYSPKFLYNYYLNNRLLIILLYLLGFLVYAGSFSITILINESEKKNNFNEARLK